VVSLVAEVCADLTGRVRVAQQPDLQFYAASTMKVPVMIAVFRRAEQGRIDLDAPIPIHRTFTSVRDGSPFVINTADVDEELTAADGQTRSVRQLLERMITLSSNNATNLLLELITLAEAQQAADDAGARNTVIARPIGDDDAAAAGIQNYVTAADLVAIMTAIATGTIASPASCQEMLQILTRQRRREGLPAGIPTQVRSASKGGWVAGLRHDVAVIWPPGGTPYCQAVCTRGLSDGEALNAIRGRAAAAYATYQAYRGAL
jgi:beta-lactamase class A